MAFMHASAWLDHVYRGDTAKLFLVLSHGDEEFLEEMHPTGAAVNGTIEMETDPVSVTAYVERLELVIGDERFPEQQARQPIVMGQTYVTTISV
jgi:hypothetical protein